MTSHGNYHRIMYQEDKDVNVILDITKNEMSLKRQGEWLTHGMFSSDGDSFLIIKNEFGAMKFDVLIDKFDLMENSLFVRYHLLEENETTSTHEYKSSWNRRDDLCHQDH